MRKVALLIFVIVFALFSFSFYSSRPVAAAKDRMAREKTISCYGFCFIK